MRRVRAECGDVGEFRLADRDVVLLTGAEANEWFFRAPEELLDQAEAYPFMTPDLRRGGGLRRSPRAASGDAPQPGPARQVHARPRLHHRRRGGAPWWPAGPTRATIDLLDWFAELTIYTSSACLIGRKFRRELDQRFARLYHDLEQGTDAIAYVDPYAADRELPPPRRRPGRSGRSGRRGSWTAGPRAPPADRRRPRPARRADVDHARRTGHPRFSADVVTGMFISMMFAGHHTTSGTAAWTLIELLRHPEEMAAVRDELDELYADGAEVSYQALREMPQLESAIKEALRLHPPLILVLRVAKEDLEVEGYRSRRASWWGPARRCPTGSPRTSPTPTLRSRRGTSSPGPRTAPTRGRGSPSAPDATAAWGRPSP